MTAPLTGLPAGDKVTALTASIRWNVALLGHAARAHATRTLRAYHSKEIAVTLPSLPLIQQTICARACRRSVAGAIIGLVSLVSAAHITNGIADEATVKVTDESFRCIPAMTPVRHFYVDNLHGDLAATVAIATAGEGDYPAQAAGGDREGADREEVNAYYSRSAIPSALLRTR